MRNLHTLDRYRLKTQAVREVYGNYGDHGCGAFSIDYRSSTLRVVASCEYGWEHVSVSLTHRCPNWEEMSKVKSMFFEDNETVMQLHVPAAEHISYHPYCLHLWRPTQETIPRPPDWMVAPGLAPAPEPKEA